MTTVAGRQCPPAVRSPRRRTRSWAQCRWRRGVAAHRLDSGRDEAVAFARLDRVGGHADRLQARRAVPVDGHARHVLEPGQHGDDPANVEARLASRLPGPHDEVLDSSWWQLRHLVEEGRDDLGREIVGADRHERALRGPADGAAGGGDDDGFWHGDSPSVNETRAAYRRQTGHGSAAHGVRRLLGADERPREETLMLVEDIEYDVDGNRMVGHLAFDDSRAGRRPAVLLSHEGSGLDDHVKGRAERLAGLGYVAFALDYFGGGEQLPTMEEAMARLGRSWSIPTSRDDSASPGSTSSSPRSRPTPTGSPPSGTLRRCDVARDRALRRRREGDRRLPPRTRCRPAGGLEEHQGQRAHVRRHRRPVRVFRATDRFRERDG